MVKATGGFPGMNAFRLGFRARHGIKRELNIGVDARSMLPDKTLRKGGFIIYVTLVNFAPRSLCNAVYFRGLR